MKHAAFILGIGLLAVYGFNSPAIGGTGPDASWTGEATPCGGPVNNEWRNDDNWDSATDPTSGVVAIHALGLCDPCDDGICLAEWCQDPPCPKYCVGGPHNGEECDTNEDCETDCEGAYYVVSYDYVDQDPDHSFTEITVSASSDHSMELQKDGANDLDITDLKLTGWPSTYKAILDVQSPRLDVSNLYAASHVDIIVGTVQEFDVTNLLETSCSSCNSVATLKGSGTLNAQGANATVRVKGTGSNTSKLDLDAIALKLDELQIYGGDASTQSGQAWFYYGSNSLMTGLDDVFMRGYSKLEVVYAGDDLTITDQLLVESVNDGITTEATLVMPSGKLFKPDRVDVVATDTSDATLIPSGGGLWCRGTNGTVTLDGNASATAELDVPSGVTVSLKDVVVKTGGKLDVHQNLTLTGTLTLEENSASGREITVRQNLTLMADVLVVKAGVNYVPDFYSGARFKTN